MNKMSTGQDSTLGNWRKMWSTFFGVNNEGYRWLTKAINESKDGENEEVITDEGQLLYALVEMSRKEVS